MHAPKQSIQDASGNVNTDGGNKRPKTAIA